jgi:beta-lactamase class A
LSIVRDHTRVAQARCYPEKQIGRDWETQYRNWATLKSALALLEALQSRRARSRESQALLLKLMTEGRKGSTQSDESLRASDFLILPSSLFLSFHLAVAAFVSDSAANDEMRDAIIARLAKAAWDRAHPHAMTG